MMKRRYLTAAAALFSIIWLAGCFSSKATENVSDIISTAGTEEEAGGQKKQETVTEEEPVLGGELPKGLTVVYTENDGLYRVSSDRGSAALPEKIVDGAGISAPVFAEDGSSAAYLKEGDLYGYSFELGREELLLREAISFVPDWEGGYLASSAEEGVVHVTIGQDPVMIWKPGAVSGGWVQCERLSLSPDGRLLAFTQRKYVNHREDPDTSPFDQNMGIWLYDRGGNTAVPVMIDKGELPFFEWVNKSEGAVYPDSWPGKWSPDSARLFIWRDVRSGSMRADGIPAAVYDVKEQKMEYLYIDKDNEEWKLEEVLLPYDENISFTAGGALIALVGGGREMAFSKGLVEIVPGDPPAYHPLAAKGLVPQSPQAAADGTVYFAASKELAKGEDAVYPIRRQLYLQKDGVVKQLTKGDEDIYSSESPMLASDEETLVFGRVDHGGNMSIWKIDTDGSGLEKLADLKQNVNAAEPEEGKTSKDFAANYKDFYGRGSWNDMMAVYVR